MIPDPVYTFSMNEIKSKEESVYNMKLFIDAAYKIIDEKTKGKKFENMVLVMGTPGCGKSTLLSSLLHGSDKM